MASGLITHGAAPVVEALRGVPTARRRIVPQELTLAGIPLTTLVDQYVNSFSHGLQSVAVSPTKSRQWERGFLAKPPLLGPPLSRPFLAGLCQSITRAYRPRRLRLTYQM